MISHVADRASTTGELTALLERLRVQPAGANTPADVTRAQLDVLLARIGSLTDALRGAEPNETTRLASRLLINDLAAVAAQFRGDANAMRASLASALDGVANALAQAGTDITAD